MVAIVGLGIDSIEIYRFSEWKTFSTLMLQRIFSDEEIGYSLSVTAKSAERFAVRFAVREAFYKALSSYDPAVSVPFLTVCKRVYVTKEKGVPRLVVDWNLLKNYNGKEYSLKVHCSLTHNRSIATAVVILECIP